MADGDGQGEGVFAAIREVIVGWGPAVLGVLLVRTLIFEPFRIPSGSMIPTLQIGDQIVVSKFSYGLWIPATLVDIPFMDSLFVAPRFQLVSFGEPQRGDIIVFRFPRDTRLHYVKRVVGIPGDRIRVENNQVILNGVLQPRTEIDRYPAVDQTCHTELARRYVEDLSGVKHEVLTNLGGSGMLANTTEFLVPEGNVFVMGDNRDNSEDSRAWRFVSYDKIKGKAKFIWLSWDGCAGGIGSVRLDRIPYNLYSGRLTEPVEPGAKLP